MKFLLDLILLLIIAYCAWDGYKKGLVMCIGTILAIIISLYVGNLIGETYSSVVQPALRPFVGGYMDGTEGIITENMNELLGSSATGLSIDDALELHPEMREELCAGTYEQVGIYNSVAKRMATKAIALSDQQDIPLSSAIVDVACKSLAFRLIFILFFLLTLIILTVVGNLFNLSFKIPGKVKLNKLGGAISGAVVGILLSMVIIWFIKFCGAFLPEDEMSHTILTAIFLKLDFLSLILTV